MFFIECEGLNSFIYYLSFPKVCVHVCVCVCVFWGRGWVGEGCWVRWEEVLFFWKKFSFWDKLFRENLRWVFYMGCLANGRRGSFTNIFRTNLNTVIWKFLPTIVGYTLDDKALTRDLSLKIINKKFQFFKLLFWLPQGQLWGIIEWTAWHTQC